MHGNPLQDCALSERAKCKEEASAQCKSSMKPMMGCFLSKSSEGVGKLDERPVLREGAVPLQK